jgi:hypothetical protein
MDFTNLFNKQIDDIPSDGEWRFGWRSAERFGDGGDSCYVAKFYIHQLKGNDAPYVSRVSFNKWVKGIPVCVESDETVLRNVFPELVELNDVHLASTVTGQPMHYIANAQYWAAVVMGISERPNTDVDAPAAFRRRVFAGMLEDDKATWLEDDKAMMAPIFAPIHVSPPKGIIFEQYAASKEGLDEQRAILNERVRWFCQKRIPALKRNMERILKEFRLAR